MWDKSLYILLLLLLLSQFNHIIYHISLHQTQVIQAVPYSRLISEINHLFPGTFPFLE